QDGDREAEADTLAQEGLALASLPVYPREADGEGHVREDHVSEVALVVLRRPEQRRELRVFRSEQPGVHGASQHQRQHRKHGGRDDERHGILLCWYTSGTRGIAVPLRVPAGIIAPPTPKRVSTLEEPGEPCDAVGQPDLIGGEAPADEALPFGSERAAGREPQLPLVHEPLAEGEAVGQAI